MEKILLLLLFFSLLFSLASAQEQKTAVIFANEACGHCSTYLSELKQLLQEHGYVVQEKFIMGSEQARQELAQANRDFNVPAQLQGHLMIKLGDVLLQGHVPTRIVGELLDMYPNGDFPKLVIYQDSMAEESQLKSFVIMDEEGKIKELPISASLKDSLSTAGKQLPVESLLSLVLFTGLIDGINPCAFGVLLFFIAFLFAIKSSRKNILFIGIAYIAMIYLAYFLIGIGLLQAFATIGFPHIISKLGAVLVAIVGLFNLKDYFFPGKGPSLKMPAFSSEFLKKWMYKATLSAALVLGFLVGLCTFPCSGGIYVAILSFLTTQTTYLQGLLYLVLYNVMFVLPLIVILLLAANKKTLEKIESMEKKNSGLIRLASGIIMILLGIVLWIVAM